MSKIIPGTNYTVRTSSNLPSLSPAILEFTVGAIPRFADMSGDVLGQARTVVNMDVDDQHFSTSSIREVVVLLSSPVDLYLAVPSYQVEIQTQSRQSHSLVDKMETPNQENVWSLTLNSLAQAHPLGIQFYTVRTSMPKPIPQSLRCSCRWWSFLQSWKSRTNHFRHLPHIFLTQQRKLLLLLTEYSVLVLTHHETKLSHYVNVFTNITAYVFTFYSKFIIYIYILFTSYCVVFALAKPKLFIWLSWVLGFVYMYLFRSKWTKKKCNDIFDNHSGCCM